MTASHQLGPEKSVSHDLRNNFLDRWQSCLKSYQHTTLCYFGRQCRGSEHESTPHSFPRWTKTDRERADKEIKNTRPFHCDWNAWRNCLKVCFYFWRDWSLRREHIWNIPWVGSLPALSSTCYWWRVRQQVPQWPVWFRPNCGVSPRHIPNNVGVRNQ